MSKPSRRFGYLMWIGVAFTLVILLLVYLLAQLRLRQSMSEPLPVLGQVQEFTLTNQNGRAVSLANLQGRVWVADIIFTRCAGPCPRMTRQMRELQEQLPRESKAQFVTLTTDPDFDTPAVLHEYAERFQADPANWMFLTGKKKEIASLAIDSLKLTAVPKKPEEREDPQDLFIHSTIFVVLDKQARLRGIFETGGEGTDWAASRARLLAAIRRLEAEK